MVAGLKKHYNTEALTGEAAKEALTPTKSSIPPLMERILEQKKALLEMQKNLQLQLNGVANQLFLIEQLLNPKPVVKEAPPDTPLNDTPPGTI